MKRPMLAFVAAVLIWVLVASLLDRGLRLFLDGYAAAEPALNFTVAMMVWRLVVGALASLAAGAVIEPIAPGSWRTAWVFGILWLLVFIPTHVKLWHVFPLWYHLTFLGTLVPLVLLGFKLASGQRARRGGSPVP
jgi:hypothetical protein